MTMIKLNLNGGFKTVQEGERVLEITDAKVTPSGKPNKLTLNMKDVEDGATLINNYNFTNSTSLWIMGLMLNIALGLEDGDEFDTNDASKLIGIKLKCEVKHSEYNGKTFANIGRVIEKVEDSNTKVEMSNTQLMNEIDKMYGDKTISRSDISDDLS